MNKTKKIISYALLAVGATVLALYVFFPSQRVKNVLTQRLTEELPSPMSVSIKEVEPRFPPGLTLHSVAFSLAENDVVELSRVVVKPKIGMLFTKGSGFKYKGEALSGEFGGQVLRAAESEQSLTVDLAFSGLKFKDAPGLQRLLRGSIKGTAEGNISYRQKTENTRSGEGHFKLTDGSLSMEETIYGMSALRMLELESAFELNNSTVKISKLDVGTQKLLGSATGRINLKNSLARSTVDLTANLSIRQNPSQRGKEKILSQKLGVAPDGNSGTTWKITGPVVSPMVH